MNLGAIILARKRSEIILMDEVISLSKNAKQIIEYNQLIIEDNGCCKSEMLNENGIGLKNMRSRIKDMNGIININSDCNGFRIFITVKK